MYGAALTATSPALARGLDMYDAHCKALGAKTFERDTRIRNCKEALTDALDAYALALGEPFWADPMHGNARSMRMVKLTMRQLDADMSAAAGGTTLFSEIELGLMN